MQINDRDFQTYLHLFTSLTLSLATSVSLGSRPGHALRFQFNPTPDIEEEAIADFRTAGELWSSLLTDDVTVNIDISFSDLNSKVLGEARSTRGWVSYANVRDALINDRTSTDDFTAVSHLSNRSTFDLLINRTSNHPKGSGNATPYLDKDHDTNNAYIYLTTANAKALGLVEPHHTMIDGEITFNSQINWSFNRNQGISEKSYDFVGTAAHELGHILGFVSGVDILDAIASNRNYYKDRELPYVSTADLFRFSKTSLKQGTGVIDWTANKTNKYFSVDGGMTQIASFSTGKIYGDKYQAGHWKDKLNLGIFEPTSSPGKLLEITENDLRLLDVIGWSRLTSLDEAENWVNLSTEPSITNNLVRTSIPEPSNCWGLIGLAIGLFFSQSPFSRNQTFNQ